MTELDKVKTFNSAQIQVIKDIFQVKCFTM